MENILSLRQKRAELGKAMSAAVADPEKYEAAVKEFTEHEGLLARTEDAHRREAALAAEALAVATSTPAPLAAVSTTTLRPTPGLESPEGPMKFKNLGEQLLAVRAAMDPSQAPGMRKVDRRLAPLAAPTGASESINADGAFLVQQDFMEGIFSRSYQTGEILKRVTRIQVGGNGFGFNAVDETARTTGNRFGGVQGFWIGEGNAPTSSRPKFRQGQLRMKKLGALFYATDELLSDATALGSFASMALEQELKFLAELSIFSGAGAGQPLGILNSPALVTQAAEGGQAATTINTQNVLKMWGRLWAPSRDKAIWVVNQDCLQQLGQLVLGGNATGVGQPLMIQPGQFGNAGPFGQMMSIPVIPLEYCSTLGVVGDIMLLDLSQYLLADKGEPQSAVSIHVNFTSDETVFRFIYRLDGQPMWQNVLTPLNGTNTLSPFIALAAR
jgi:HK97 family phage major capsid protein